MGGRRYAVYAHDWRGRAGAGLAGPHGRTGAGPPSQRVDLLEAELSGSLLVLSEPEFGGRAVRRPCATTPAWPPWPTTPCCARGWPPGAGDAAPPPSGAARAVRRGGAGRQPQGRSGCTGRWPAPSSSRRPPRSSPPNASACRSAPTATTWPAASGGSPSGCGSASSRVRDPKPRRRNRSGRRARQSRERCSPRSLKSTWKAGGYNAADRRARGGDRRERGRAVPPRGPSSDAYERVTVVERDELPDGDERRRAEPQAARPALLQRGQEEVEALLPGISGRASSGRASPTTLNEMCSPAAAIRWRASDEPRAPCSPAVRSSRLTCGAACAPCPRVEIRDRCDVAWPRRRRSAGSRAFASCRVRTERRGGPRRGPRRRPAAARRASRPGWRRSATGPRRTGRGRHVYAWRPIRLAPGGLGRRQARAHRRAARLPRTGRCRAGGRRWLLILGGDGPSTVRRPTRMACSPSRRSSPRRGRGRDPRRRAARRHRHARLPGEPPAPLRAPAPISRRRLIPIGDAVCSFNPALRPGHDRLGARGGGAATLPGRRPRPAHPAVLLRREPGRSTTRGRWRPAATSRCPSVEGPRPRAAAGAQRLHAAGSSAVAERDPRGRAFIAVVGCTSRRRRMLRQRSPQRLLRPADRPTAVRCMA